MGFVTFQKERIGETLLPRESPASVDCPRHVVIVMDGMKSFTTAPLEWALENLISTGCTVTLIGVMPWLNIPRMGFVTFRKERIGETLLPRESPASADCPRHVVIVMDGMKSFTTAPLEWALENLISTGCTVTLIGVMPWLNIPLSGKIWSDVWPLEWETLANLQERSKWRSDVKYLKLQAVIDLCKQYGVVPQKDMVMGYPSKLLVVEKITSLHATWVVFDRHQRKNREFYAKRIPCNMVMMNQNGEGDMFRARSCMSDSEGSTPGESPASLVPTPQVLISEELREILRQRP